MFDYVTAIVPCPNCGHAITDFQSKDGPCTLTTLPWTQVGNFYGDCDKCDFWVEFDAIPPRQTPTHTMRYGSSINALSEQPVAILPNDDIRIIDPDTGEAVRINKETQ